MCTVLLNRILQQDAPRSRTSNATTGVWGLTPSPSPAAGPRQGNGAAQRPAAGLRASQSECRITLRCTNVVKAYLFT